MRDGEHELPNLVGLPITRGASAGTIVGARSLDSEVRVIVQFDDDDPLAREMFIISGESALALVVVGRERGLLN